MSWQRRARAGLAIAGVASAVAVYMLARDRVEPPPVSLEPTDREAVAEGGALTSTRIEYSTEDVRITAEAWKEYPDGRMWYEHVYLVFTRDGVEIWAGEALARGRQSGSDLPAELELSRDVVIKTTDGLELQTPSATYQDGSGIVTMPGEVTIVKGRLTATGVGGYYDRGQELFRLQQQPHVVVSPEGGDGESVKATAGSMTLARLEQFLRLDGQARIERPTETLSGDVATLYFLEETDEIRQLDLRGHGAVIPREGVSNPTPEMRGDTVTMTFHPEQRTLSRATLAGAASLAIREGAGSPTVEAAWIDIVTEADGRSLRNLAARERVVVELPAAGESPARTIRASTLSATGAAGQGLQAARFEGDVEFEERPAGPDAAVRTGRSRVLTLGLDGGFDAIDEAEFLEQVRFSSGETTASAERAVYNAATGQLALHPVPSGGASSPPHAENDRVSVDARQITLGLDGDAVSASGDVRTITKPGAGTDDRQTALFAPDRPVVGTSAEFEYTGGTGRAIYRGTEEAPARLLQDASEIAGNLVEIDEESGDLTATGAVESVFELEPAGEAAADAEPTTYRIAAASLEYREATRTATYRGDPVTLTSGTIETEAELVVLTLAENARDVQTVEWTGPAVYALMEGGYEAKGTRLRYVASTGEYRLEGSPAVTKLPGENGADCVRSSGLVTIFNRRTGENSWPPEANPRGRMLSEPMKCGASIR